MKKFLNIFSPETDSGNQPDGTGFSSSNEYAAPPLQTQEPIQQPSEASARPNISVPTEEPKVIIKEEENPKDPEESPQTTVLKLQRHEMDVPEEPESVHVITQVWDPAKNSYVEKDLGVMLLVPTGCDDCEEVNPYDNTVSFKSALPRDKQLDANLYQCYQTNGWASRAWIRKQLDEEIDGVKVDKEIMDDIPVIQALQGKGEGEEGGMAGVAQTAGVEGKGDNNGAPLPPGPGPGRGNKKVPGDKAAGRPPLPKNASPGTGV